MWHVLKMQSISLLPKYIKWISRGLFYTCVNMGCWNVNTEIMNLGSLKLNGEIWQTFDS
jgi:hypothetical protein